MKRNSSNFFLTRSKKICPFGGQQFCFIISFWRLFFEVKGRYLQIFKKVFNYKIPLMFESENLAMHELLARSQILLFFGIGLIKIYLIGTKVPVFKNRKKGSISLHPNVQQHVGTGPLPPPLINTKNKQFSSTSCYSNTEGWGVLLS